MGQLEKVLSEKWSQIPTDQEFRNLPDTVAAHHCPASSFNDVSPTRHHQQSMLGAIEKMNEEVTIHMPSIHFVNDVGLFAFILRCPEVDNERVIPPVARVDVDAVLAAAELADRSPGLWREFGGAHRVTVTGGKVGHWLAPGGHVIWIEGKARPKVAGHMIGRCPREARFEVDEAMLHPGGDLFRGEMVIFAGGGMRRGGCFSEDLVGHGCVAWWVGDLTWRTNISHSVNVMILDV